jgi:hypothetical protein
LSTAAVTSLLAVALVGLCFALIGLRMLFVKGGAFRGTCAGPEAMGVSGCSACPRSGSCEESRAQDPKSSKAMFDRGTPKSSSMRSDA